MKMANLLTLSRIFFAPLFILFFLINTTWSLAICILIVFLIELTDFFDGRVARKREEITDFGKLMDPFADSVARFSIFLCFLDYELAPVWIIVIFFYRDVLVSVIRLFSIKFGVVVSARRSGKIKAWAQGLAIFAVLGLLLFDKLDLISWPVPLFAKWLIIAAAVVTLWSGIDYWKANKHMFHRARKIER
ncbi:CDP-diacylglycerol--glycerol-3-phosphate 3-phosphatidyltransferase [candidate division KSB1 bacterium]|nr:CDP-diacylglycerol--glycerol-3-phosphate 3-phosphatidyltransferase [candidate division KSB1 bacterium]